MASLKYRDPVTGQMVPLLDNGVTMAYGDNTYINLAGDTVTGVVSVPAPTLGGHAVDRAYVDHLVPPGMLAAFNSNTIPVGWLLCNGQLVSQTIYADLYAVLGTKFGAGSGKFGVPNLKGRTPLGVDPGNGSFGSPGMANPIGDMNNTITAATAANSSGYFQWNNAGNRTSQHAEGGVFYGTNVIGQYANPQYYHAAAYSMGRFDLTYGGGGGAHSNLQRYAVLNWIVKT